MATLALSVAGAAIGGAVLPAGISVLGATISGAVIGQQAGALAGSVIDQALFSTSGQSRAVSGPRLSDLKVTTSIEGAAIPRLFGRARLGGQLIWATDLEEEAVTTRGGSGSGKGRASSGGSAVTRTDYRYFANVAIALAEGPITGIGRVWADGSELDLSQFTWRLYHGTETQNPDSLIVAREVATLAPAYRGVAYIVFEHLPLAAFGNRIPQFSFEVYRATDPFESEIRAVVMIPGSGEFVYATEPVTRRIGAAQSEAENTHTLRGGTDWDVALDQLAETLPNAKSTSLVVSWFGSDLRADQCLVRPAVDTTDKETNPIAWSVAGLTRSSAPVVSAIGDRASYGGTPSDQTVVAAIRDLKARGHKVLLTPFILMDIPSGNALPDPYSTSASQPAYPWRGRITVAPAPGRPGTPDKTPAVAAAVANFVGTASPAHFGLDGETVVYTGPVEWTLRRQILHYAKLAVAGGGVDAIVIGTELRGLTQLRSGAATYPFVAALVALAADVKSIVGPGTQVTYAADWSEYFGHQPPDGTGDVAFHLDPLWSSPSIDAIAIDCYWPLADWREGRNHLDAQAGVRSIYDLDYLKSNLFAGEGFDWYYASQADRDAQVRSPITDGAGKPWIFRYKDLKSWWLNAHYNRPGGVEAATPTSWVPQSKPVWLTEIGSPAVDKGANQPNVFVDPKSAESFLPYYSTGDRDDLVQRRYLQAILEAFDPAHPGYIAGANPVSSVYGGRMLDLEHIHVYAWDARPYPAFPANALVWGDGENWRLGHWINGRLAAQPLSVVVGSLLEGYGFTDFDVSELDGSVTGFVIDRVMSGREALQPLELAYFFDTLESGAKIRFRMRGAGNIAQTVSPDDLVETRAGADLMRLTRAQETELPASARITFSAPESDYRQAVASSRRLIGASTRVSSAELAVVMDSEQATRTVDTWLFEAWAARDRASFALPPSRLALEPGDVIMLDHAGRERPLRIVEIGEHGARDIEARSIDPEIYVGAVGAGRPVMSGPIVPAGEALGVFLDLPLLDGAASASLGYLAAAKQPWPGGGVAFYRSADTSGFALSAIATRPATTGVTLDAMSPGPEGVFDKATNLRVRLDQGALTTTTEVNLLSGANAAAIQAADGSWEVVQFQTATLSSPRTYELMMMLRSQLGTEQSAAAGIPAGARFVLLDASIVPTDLAQDDRGLPLNWRFGPANRDLGDASYTTRTVTFAGVSLRPLSPCHVRGARSGGNLAISWVRRTRSGGDSWTAAEVPLAEDIERYEIDILAGMTVLRTLSATSATVVYTAADQVTDFGSVQSAISVRVVQISVVAGRGAARNAVI